MLLQFANGRSQLPPPTIAVTTGGTNSTARSLYFALQGQNIAGYNLLSTIVGPVSIGINQQVTITIPSTAHVAGELFSDYVISASLTNVAADFVQVARVPAHDSGGADISLPMSIVLSADEHFNLSAIVSAPANLPTTALISGMRRGVASLAYVFEYDPLGTQTPNNATALSAAPAPGNWLRVGGFSTVVSNTTSAGGCAQDVRAINEAAIKVKPYACNGQNGIGHRFWMVNDSTESLPAGLRVMIGVTLGEVPSSGLFEGLLRVIFRGYVNTTDGTVRTAISTGETMRGLNQEVLFENKKTDLLLEDDLQPNEAYALDIYPNLRPEFLNNQVSNHSLIKVSVGLALQAGAYVEGGSAQGDSIYPDYDRKLVVPQRVGGKCLKGSGMVNSRSFLGRGESLIVGLLPNTTQFVFLNSDGFTYLKREPKNQTEAIRAKVSTIAGVSNPSPWSAPIVVTANGGIDITCHYPSNGTRGIIRANYPDPLLIGNNKGQFNCQILVLYVRSTVGGVSTIKKFPGKLIVDGASQVFQLSDWNAGVTISGLPAAPSLDFCLFEAVSADLVADGVGNFPAGTIETAYAYELDGTQISAISHNRLDGCLLTSTLDRADIEESTQYWAPGVRFKADLRAVPLAKIIGLQTRYLDETSRPYRYKPSVVASDDDYSVIKPDEKLSTEPGRWVIDDNSQFTPRGAWNITASYVAGNLVRRLGSVYLAIATSIGVAPESDTTELMWQVFVNKGDKGDTGAAGAIGATGAAGAAGATGATGATGSIGLRGLQGLPGVKGDPGVVTAANAVTFTQTTAASITTATNETGLFVDSADGRLKQKAPSSGAIETIAITSDITAGSGDGGTGSSLTISAVKPVTTPSAIGQQILEISTELIHIPDQGTPGAYGFITGADVTVKRHIMWVAIGATSNDWLPLPGRPIYLDVLLSSNGSTSYASVGHASNESYSPSARRPNIPKDHVGQNLIERIVDNGYWTMNLCTALPNRNGQLYWFKYAYDTDSLDNSNPPL